LLILTDLRLDYSPCGETGEVSVPLRIEASRLLAKVIRRSFYPSGLVTCGYIAVGGLNPANFAVIGVSISLRLVVLGFVGV
jgi:hypothetical protein